MEITEARKDFPMLSQKMHGKPLIYFDSAATAQKPQIVIDKITQFYAEQYGTVHRAIYDLAVYSTETYDEARRKVQKLLNAELEEEIIFTKGTTEALNLIAFSLGEAFIHAGDDIIISEAEHHSNIVPWQLMCARKGANLKVIPIDDRGVIDVEMFHKLVSEKTKVVSLALVSNSLGTRQPVEEIIKGAHAKGALVVIDGAQSTPHMQIDVQALGCDFYAFSGHKFYGPTGIGVLYGKMHLLEKMPPYQGGGDMIATVSFERTTFQPPPLRFEAGTPPFAEAIALGVAIDYIQSIGLDKIEKYEQMLLEVATKKMETIPGLRIIGTAPKKGAIISFTVEGLHSLDIGTLLDLKGIAVRTGHHCNQPVMNRFGLLGTCRASFSFYNTVEEIEVFFEALKEVIQTLRANSD